LAASSNGPSVSELTRIKELFLQVKPGDVITYAGETAADGTDNGSRSGAHIGIVNGADYDTINNAQTIYGIFSGIEVIECVYNQKLFNVFSLKMTEGPKNNSKKLESKTDINNWYLTSTVPYPWKIDKIYRKWSIQRLGGK
jgi:hypothetical protein